MHTTRVTLADRRRHADQTTVRWRVMVGTGVIGLLATLAVGIWGDPQSRADEGLVLIVTVLVVGIAPIAEWISRFALARVSTLTDRLLEADREIARLVAERSRLEGVLRIEDFVAEGADFGALSAPIWEQLERAFAQYRPPDVTGRRLTLHQLVDAAAWPDRLPPRKRGPGGLDAIEPTTVDEVMSEFASCVFPPFGFELVPRETFAAFDQQRRNLRRRIRQWGERLGSEQRDEVRAWLRTALGPAHGHTVKAAWYLEIANSTRTGENVATDEGYWRSVRDAIEPETPAVRDRAEVGATWPPPAPAIDAPRAGP
jgi:hypothetical protein